MKNKSFLIAILFMSIILPISGQKEQDYNFLFHNLQSNATSINLANFLQLQIGVDKESQNYITKGLKELNLIYPYVNKESNLKNIVSRLINYKLTLRSARNIQVFQNAVNAIVLIVAPDIGSGAGFIIDKNQGLVVTNYHVTSGLKDLLVAFYDPAIQEPTKLKFIPASVFRYDAKKDIAILKLGYSGRNLQQLNLSPQRPFIVGEEVHTIGHPLSLVWSYSHGLITALRNRFQFGNEENADVIQIDASISPGNSGGPLIDENGTVIGMVTFSASAKNAQNLNFAISSSEISKVLRMPSNEDTKSSKIVNGLKGQKLFSYNDLLKEYIASQFTDNNGAKYISLKNKKTNKEEYRYARGVDIEIEKGKSQKVNLLAGDANGDGVLDLFFVDYNLDNIFDVVLIDINQDGEPDIIGIDSEKNGYISKVWIL